MTSIDQIVSERHLLGHPFYQRWQEGKVSLEVLREYARQYYAYESRLPRFLEAALAHLDEGPAKSAVGENLADESGRPEPHPELWLRFAEALGVSRREVLEAEPLPGTRKLVETYASLCGEGADEALAAIYAYEAQFSAVAAAKADGLRRFYGLTDPQGLEFFDLHASLDDDHAAAIRSGLPESEQARAAAERALAAWWGMLDSFEALSEAVPEAGAEAPSEAISED